MRNRKFHLQTPKFRSERQILNISLLQHTLYKNLIPPSRYFQLLYDPWLVSCNWTRNYKLTINIHGETIALSFCVSMVTLKIGTSLVNTSYKYNVSISAKDVISIRSFYPLLSHGPHTHKNHKEFVVFKDTSS